MRDLFLINRGPSEEFIKDKFEATLSVDHVSARKSSRWDSTLVVSSEILKLNQ